MADVVKKIGAKSSTGSEMIVKDVGSEAQNVNISYDVNGDIIEDINEPGIVINSTKSAVKAIKDINIDLNKKINKTELSKKVSLDANGKINRSILPDFIDDVIEGYYEDKTTSLELPYGFIYGSAVVLNNEIHILGSALESDKLKHYKWNGTKWISVSTLPYHERNFNGFTSAVVYNNEIHMLGGMYNNNNTFGSTDHYKWDGTSWIEVSTLPYEFYDGSAVVYNDEIHILGGGGGRTNHYKWNGTSWELVSTLSFPFNKGSAIVYNNEIHTFARKHYKWDGTNWTEVSTMPYTLEDGYALILYDEIHIFGGMDTSSSYEGRTNHYIWDEEDWIEDIALPYKTGCGGAVALNNGELCLLGGYAGGMSTVGKNFYILDNGVWSNTIIIKAFYKDIAQTTEIQGEENKIYIDKTGNALYYYENNKFIKLLDEEPSLVGLSNVEITNLRDGDSLVYDNSKHKWVNQVTTNHIVQLPIVEGDTFTYNGQPQGPTITYTDPEFNKYVELVGSTKATNVSDIPYQFTYRLRNSSVSCWNDGTNENKTYSFTINKADGFINTDKNAVVLTPSKTSDTITITESSGTVSVSNVIPQGVVSVSPLSNNIINVISQDNGQATITLTAPATSNYNAVTKTISVDVTDIPLVSWDLATNDQVIAMVNGYYNGDLSLGAIKSVWAVGQKRQVTINAIPAATITNTEVSSTGLTIDTEAHVSQTVEMTIIDFEHDDLTTSINGKTKALITIGQENCLTDGLHENNQENDPEIGEINESGKGSIGGWKGCPRRTWCNNNYYNALPQYLQDLIKSVNKLTGGTDGSSVIIVSSDKCWLPSENELDAQYFSAPGEGYPYPYYEGESIDITNPTICKKPKWRDSFISGTWWLRSPVYSYEGQIVYNGWIAISKNGNFLYSAVSDPRGIAPHFCI